MVKVARPDQDASQVAGFSRKNERLLDCQLSSWVIPPRDPYPRKHAERLSDLAVIPAPLEHCKCFALERLRSVVVAEIAGDQAQRAQSYANIRGVTNPSHQRQPFLGGRSSPFEIALTHRQRRDGSQSSPSCRGRLVPACLQRTLEPEPALAEGPMECTENAIGS